MICPLPDCGNTIGPTELLCRTHWFMVSKDTRNRVWFWYRRAPKSPNHIRAIRAALLEARTAMETINTEPA